MTFTEIFVCATTALVFVELVNWKLWSLREQRRFNQLFNELKALTAEAGIATQALQDAVNEMREDMRKLAARQGISA